MEIDKKDLEVLKSLEEKLWLSEFRFDQNWMEDVLAPDFFEYGMSSRIYERKDTLDVPAQEIKAILPLENFKVRMIENNVAQLSYVSNVEFEGTMIRALRSSIWSYDGVRWMIRFHQGTPLKDSGSD